jgi:ABC-type protease/lipase transport system fused ATPase/permease subunit
LALHDLLVEPKVASRTIAAMKLSEADMKVIQRLGRNEETWVSARWAALLIGLLMLSGSAFMFQRIWSTVDYDQILIMLCLFVAPASGIVLFVGVAALLYVFAFWNGRATNKLLLRLADEVESQGK